MYVQNNMQIYTNKKIESIIVKKQKINKRSYNFIIKNEQNIKIRKFTNNKRLSILTDYSLKLN